MPVSSSRAMLVDFPRVVFCHRASATFSLPNPFVEEISWQWCDCDSGDLVDTLERAATGARVRYEASPDEVFFKVLRANPIAKTLLRPSHASYSTATASVCICEVSGNDLLTWTHRPSKRMPLDLTCLSRLDNLRRLKVWKSAIGGAEACVSDDIVDHLAG